VQSTRTRDAEQRFFPFEAGAVDIALERMQGRWVEALRRRKIDRPGAGRFDVAACRVEMSVRRYFAAPTKACGLFAACYCVGRTSATGKSRRAQSANRTDRHSGLGSTLRLRIRPAFLLTTNR
jgi:hypothetical protein